MSKRKTKKLIKKNSKGLISIEWLGKNKYTYTVENVTVQNLFELQKSIVSKTQRERIVCNYSKLKNRLEKAIKSGQGNQNV